jgi:hypothetical protein
MDDALNEKSGNTSLHRPFIIRCFIYLAMVPLGLFCGAVFSTIGIIFTGSRETGGPPGFIIGACLTTMSLPYLLWRSRYIFYYLISVVICFAALGVLWGTYYLDFIIIHDSYGILDIVVKYVIAISIAFEIITQIQKRKSRKSI